MSDSPSATEPVEPVEEPAAEPGEPIEPSTAEPARVAVTTTPATCPRPTCNAPDLPCVMGILDELECEHWREAAAPTDTDRSSGERPPWSGEAMGEVDLEAVATLSRARLVALVGLPKAGKTSALVSYFNQLRHGHRPGGFAFAGSYSLLGWYGVSQNLEFPPDGGRGFPGHTTISGEGRSAAVLHVTLSTTSGTRRSLLFTDVPGEWFEEWSVDSSAVPGAEWIASRADLFVVLSDSAALAGAERGAARSRYKVLAARVATAANGRPVMPVRAKADIAVPDDIDEALRATDMRLFGSEAHPLSVIANDQGAPLLDVFDELTAAACDDRRLELGDTPPAGDVFLDFRSAT